MMIDLLLVAALTAVAVAVGLWSPVIGLLVFAAGCVGLWFALDEA
jgi:hypothetical protein